MYVGFSYFPFLSSVEILRTNILSVAMMAISLDFWEVLSFVNQDICRYVCFLLICEPGHAGCNTFLKR